MARPSEGSRPTRASTGTAMAIVSAAAFGSSGPMAKALLEGGWTAGAAVLVRLGGAALILGVAALVATRGRLRLRGASVRTLLVYGVVAMAVVQLAFFNAVRTLDVGVALLIEYLAPVLLLAWTSLRTRTRPRRQTLLGAAATVVGLVLVLDPSGASSVDPVGVAWALLAAVCLGAYFVISDRQDDELGPLVMAAGGTAIGALTIAAAGLVGAVPLAFTTGGTVLAGASTSWMLPAGWLVLVSTVAAYLTGISAIARLGARSASFLALGEVLFAVLVAWLLLAELPGPAQLAGGACIVAGIVVVRRDDHVALRRATPLEEPQVA